MAFLDPLYARNKICNLHLSSFLVAILIYFSKDLCISSKNGAFNMEI